MNATHPINYYLPRLSDVGLTELVSVNLELVQHAAPALYKWLSPILIGEHERRHGVDEADEPKDVELPNAALFLLWSGAELGIALRWVTMMSYLLKDKSAGEFIDNVVRHITSTVEIQLLELDELKVGT